MRKFDCPLCGWTGHPSFELSGKGKLVACCQGRECTYQDPALSPADFNEGHVKDGVSKQVTVVETEKRQALPASAQPLSPPRAAPITMPIPEVPTDILGAIKKRRDYLESEIARLEGFRLEKRKLDKMLKVAMRAEAQVEAALMPIPSAETN